MTEIAGIQSAEIAPLATGGGLAALPQTAAVVQLQEWAAELTAAHTIASALARSNFLPKALREKGRGVVKSEEEMTNDAAAVILAGKSVGLDPLQSVQNIFPVHGMPSMYARTMGALVISQGHGVRRTAATNDSVTYMVRRKGDQEWQEFTWDIARAEKAGYLSNAKYTSDPIAMLGAKALAEACRTVFADILLGMAYSAEDLELEDMGEIAPAAPVEAAKATRPTITRSRPRPTAKAEPPAAPAAPAAAAPAAAPVEPAADQATGEVIDPQGIPESVRSNAAKCTTAAQISDYSAYLMDRGAPSNVISWVNAQAPTETPASA